MLTPQGIPPNEQCVIILCGLPGSGKSTVSRLLVQRSASFGIVNQDELGNRRTCERLFGELLLQGASVICDRCNFNRQQREVWIKITRDILIHKVKIFAVVLEVPEAVCITRVHNRVNHPNLVGPEGARVINIIQRQYCRPSMDEGFDSIFVCSTDEDIERACCEIERQIVE